MLRARRSSLASDHSQVYAGAGDDVFELSPDNVTGDGSQGQPNLLHGGAASDTVLFNGSSADYVIEQRDGYLLVSHVSDPARQETLVNVERLEFSDTTISVENRAELGVLAGLYQNALARQADLIGFEYWANQQSGSALSLGQIALSIASSAESASRGITFTGEAQHDVEMLYQSIFGRASDANGKAYWLSQMSSDSLSLEDVATAFVASIEMSGYVQTATDWDFIA
jgi:hypothetical protein